MAKFIIVPTLFSLLAMLPSEAGTVTAREILQQVLKQNFTDTFRVAVSIRTFHNKKEVSTHDLWFVSSTKDNTTAIFVDFAAPPESKGLRFLFLVRPQQQPEAFMYAPSAQKTLPLALDDQGAEIGSTGLTMEDIQAFVPQAGQEETLVKEEPVDGRQCYLIRITSQQRPGARLVWVGKDFPAIVRSQELDSNGKVTRTFRVVEFFKDEQGREYPRFEEITVPAKNVRIEVRQEHAVFGIQVPEQILDPKTFGTFQWMK
ncbi:MAG: outer membrane lipoprotein-sorting protein [Desulfomonile sp.]|nr:outer membrane lipoprotein-sorting protein [Desulfomonile sp.]